jgi:hypothetical protein
MTPTQRRVWRKHVFGHLDLTAAQKLALLALETFADYPDGTNARPGVARLAETCGLRTRVVEGALQQGRLLGLIEQTGRANPKRGYAACYRLVSIRTAVRVEDLSSRTSVRTEDESQPAPNEFQPARIGVSTRMSVQPTNTRTPRQNTKDDDAREMEPPDLNPEPNTPLLVEVEPPQHIDNAARPSRQHPSDAARWVVRQELGDDYPRESIDRLAVQVAKLARAGHPDALIRESLREWERRLNCDLPEFLPTVYGDVVKRSRAAPHVTPGEVKVLGWAELGNSPKPEPVRKAIG